VATLAVGLIIIVLIPLIIYHFKKLSWQISKK